MFCACTSKSKEVEWSVDPSQAVEVKLTSFESNFFGLQEGEGVGVVTFYDGPALAAKTIIQERTNAIIEANPWLGGTLVKKNGLAHMLYQPNHVHPGCFKAGVVSELWGSGSHIERLKYSMIALQPYVVGKGKDLYGACDKPLFQVALLTERPLGENPQKFAVAVTVTHIIADGYTFYTLYKMLDPKAEIVTMKAARSDDFGEKEDQLVGGFAAMTGCMIGMVGNMLLGKKRAIEVYEVDTRVLASRKTECTEGGDVEFVSTNDILTAAFFKATNDDVNFMAINLRGKVPEYKNDMAGNYESIIWYTQSDVSPALIRKSLQPKPGFFRAGEPASTYPSLWTRMKGAMNNATNWATFYGDVVLPGCTQTHHMPVIGYDGVASCMNAAIIFRPTGDRLAVVCVAHEPAQSTFAAGLNGAVLKT